ncbi:HU family DNA-binding protein [Nitrosospira multiformis]|uniref:HU family DNA-binding protein n=1 Tax=Nitrosospira multiformis TaxID=1231 RepID=UPI000B20E849
MGTFEVRERSERTGRNPKTGEQLKIGASKVPAFKPGATLKAAVSGKDGKD